MKNYPSAIKVGRYNEQQLKAKQDKIDLAKVERESGFKFAITRIGKLKGKQYIDIYLVSNEDYINSTEL